MKVLLLATYCGDEDEPCSDGLPCEECLKMCNVVEIPDDTEIKPIAGWVYLREISQEERTRLLNKYESKVQEKEHGIRRS